MLKDNFGDLIDFRGLVKGEVLADYFNDDLHDWEEAVVDEGFALLRHLQFTAFLYLSSYHVEIVLTQVLIFQIEQDHHHRVQTIVYEHEIFPIPSVAVLNQRIEDFLLVLMKRN